MFDKEIIVRYFTEYLLSSPPDLIAFFSGFIPLIALIANFKAVYAYHKSLVVYGFIILILEVIGGIYAANSKNNHLIYLVFYFFETILLYFFYKNSIKNSKFNLINTAIIVVILIGIINNIFKTKSQINDFSLSIQSLGFTVIAVLNFYYLLFFSKKSDLYNSSFFWVNTGSIIYFAGNFFVSLFETSVLNEHDYSLSYLYDIVSVLLVVFRIFLAIGISKCSIVTNLGNDGT